MKHHVILVAENDADIIAFKNYLPYGKFNETVNRILWHAVRGDIPDDPMRFEIDVYAPTMHTKVELPAELEKKCRDRYRSSGEPFTTGIKNDIKRYLWKNRQDIVACMIDTEETRRLLLDAEKSLDEIRKRYENTPEQNKQILKAYRATLDNLANVFNRKNDLMLLLAMDEKYWE